MKPEFMVAALFVLLAGFGVFLALNSGSFCTSPELGDYCELLRAMDGSPDLEKLEVLAQREDGVGYQARLAAGRSYLAAGNFPQAVKFLDSALELYPTADVRLELARALLKAGRADEALAHWIRLLPRAEAKEAVRRLEGDPVRVAALFNGSGLYADALAVIANLQSPEARLQRARALVGLGRAMEALPEFQAYLAARPGDGIVRLEYGRALKRAGKLDQALATFRALGPAGAYDAGQLLIELGRTNEAIQAFFTSTDPECQFRAARLMESVGRTQEALDIYVKLATNSHRVSDDASLRAFSIYLRQGQKVQAEKMAELLPPALKWIAGIYRPPPLWVAPEDPWPTETQAIKRANALLAKLPAHGKEWARIELELALRTTSPEEKLSIGEWYLAQGDFRRACHIGMEIAKDLPVLRAYRLAYPLAYYDTVLQWAETFGVDPYLVLAVMREESHFASWAVSSSDAKGLMQLLPSTAKWIAEKLGDSFREEELFRPEVNIKFGTWYLAHLLSLFSDVAKAVAAYNGGPGNVNRWLRDPTYQGPMDFPGVLAHTETREYLVKVLNSWLTYRWLYGVD